MRWLYLIVSVILICSVQFIALSHVRTAPDLLLIFAIFLALNASRELALVGAWLCGLFSEVSTGQTGQERIGALAFLFTFFAWVLSKHRLELFSEHWLTRAVIVAVVGLVCSLGRVATVYLETRQLAGWRSWQQMLLGVLVTTVFSIPLFVLFSRVRGLYAQDQD